MKKELLHIGTIELVSLPNDQIYNVPAKIDTGADSSAIWASDIVLKNGKLSFNFFAPGSSHYRTNRIVTTAYRTTSVKNSFGHEEFRFKIRLTVTIGKHRITRWFSLADRSRNTYPILLGKNFLKNRFVVDVARKHVVSEAVTNNVLVLSSGQTDLTEKFLEDVVKHNEVRVEYTCDNYENVQFVIDGPATSVTQADSGKDLADFSFVYFKAHNKQPEFAAAVAEYLHFRGRPYADHELDNYVSSSKLSEYMKLTCFDLPIPTSICMKTALLVNHYEAIVAELGTPFVLKEIASDQGKNNYLIANKKDFKGVLDKASSDMTFMAQRFIPNEGFLRLYVVGKEVQLVVERTPEAHNEPLKQHLNKPAGSRNATKLDIDDVSAEVKDIAVRAAISMNRQVAGVDMLQDKDSKKWYILEVNNAPQIRSGSFISDKAAMMAHYFDKELNR